MCYLDQPEIWAVYTLLLVPILLTKKHSAQYYSLPFSPILTFFHLAATVDINVLTLSLIKEQRVNQMFLHSLSRSTGIDFIYVLVLKNFPKATGTQTFLPGMSIRVLTLLSLRRKL